MSTHANRFFVTCAKGTEGALRRELVAMRIRAPRGAAGGVSFAGTFMDGMRVCLHSRVAVRVLQEIVSFAAEDAESLYAATRKVDWTDFIGRSTTLAVNASTQDNPNLHHSGFAALKVKDAVVDMLRDRHGRRPDVNPRDPDVAIVLHLRGRDARLFVDLAGEPLHRRGYRVAMVEAPLKETLAASVLALGGVSTERPFLDPMAGSGTLAIEHALVSRGIAPGLHRRFGFQRWATHEQLRIWATLVKAARDAVVSRSPCPIVARDIDRSAIGTAQRNADAAGVLRDIVFEVGDIAALPPQTETGTLCTNPPYGERLLPEASGSDVQRLYARVAQSLAPLAGWRAVILAGNPAILRALGRKPTVSHRLWNGPLEARLLVFEL